MKYIALLTILALLTISCSTPRQNLRTLTDENATSSFYEASKDELEVILQDVEEEPEFEGGVENLYYYLNRNIKFPQAALEGECQGKVIVRFVVETDGSISNIEVTKDIGGGCGEEAVRVIKEMPKWKPGKVNGKPVRVIFSLPISFELR